MTAEGVRPGAVPDRDGVLALLSDLVDATLKMAEDETGETDVDLGPFADRILALLPSAPATLDHEKAREALGHCDRDEADDPDTGWCRRWQDRTLDALVGCVRTTPDAVTAAAVIKRLRELRRSGHSTAIAIEQTLRDFGAAGE